MVCFLPKGHAATRCAQFAGKVIALMAKCFVVFVVKPNTTSETIQGGRNSEELLFCCWWGLFFTTFPMDTLLGELMMLWMINVGISYATMKRIYSEVREVIANYMLLEIYNTPLRGRIQIDEALFTHRAGPGRRGLRQVWVVGMIEERSSEVFCFVVPTRNARVINGLITTHCLFGSYIIHDGWGGYSRIPNTYTHHRYRHHINDPDNTSRIEGVWGELRAFMRNIYSGGVVETNVRSLIQELVFRRRCRERNLVFIDELVYALNNY